MIHDHDEIETSFVLDEDQIQEIKESVNEIFAVQSLVSGDDNYWRTSETINGFHYSLIPDQLDAIGDWIQLRTGQKLQTTECELLIYQKGQYFKRHKDVIPRNPNWKWLPRTYTTVTMIDKTDDLEGGNLIVYDHKDDTIGHSFNLEIGETIAFRSALDHEATKIMQGKRMVLVAWYHPCS